MRPPGRRMSNIQCSTSVFVLQPCQCNIGKPNVKTTNKTQTWTRISGEAQIGWVTFCRRCFPWNWGDQAWFTPSLNLIPMYNRACRAHACTDMIDSCVRMFWRERSNQIFERPQLLWRNFRSNCGALGLRSGSWKQARSFDSREQRLDDNRLRVDGFVKVRWVAESQMGEWIGEWDQFLRLPITFDCSWVWDSSPHCCCMKHFFGGGHFMPRQVVERRK